MIFDLRPAPCGAFSYHGGVDDVKLLCECGLAYTWRDANAGCGFKCLCGRRLRMPADKPTHDIALEPHLKTKAHRRVCPACLTLMAMNDRVCVACGFNRAEGRRAHVRRDRKKSEFELKMEAIERREERKRVVLAGAVSLVMAGWYVWAMPMSPGVPHGWSAPLLVLWTMVGMVAMIGSAKAMSRYVDFELEPFWPTLLKLLAVFLALHVVRAQAIDWAGLSQTYAGAGGDGLIGGYGAAFYIVFALLLCGLVVPSVVVLACVQLLWDETSLADRLAAWAFIMPVNLIVTCVVKAAGVPG